MDFLADENVPKYIVKSLRTENHLVKDLKEEKLFGITDVEVLKIAQKEHRILLTLDKDFLYLPRQKLIPKIGIIILKVSGKSIQSIMQSLLTAIKLHSSKKFETKILIVSHNYIEIINADF